MKTTSIIACTFLLAAAVCFGSPSETSTPADPAKAAKLEKRFSKLDLNSDKLVDREEFTKARFAKKNPERTEKRFTRTDKDSDGRITKEEWMATPRRKNTKTA